MMDNINYERLYDRDLWVDGTSTFNINSLCNEILSGNIDFLSSGVVSENTKNEIVKFSKLTNEKIPTVSVKSCAHINTLNTDFKLPEKYSNISLEKKIVQGFKKRHSISIMNIEEKERRLYRISDELERYSKMGLSDVLKCTIYIIDKFKENKVIWGPGRGSACCSYILYLLELHDIDSFSFELSIDEFLR